MSTILIIDKTDNLIDFCKENDQDNKFLKCDNFVNATRMMDTETVDLVVIELEIAQKAKLDLKKTFPKESIIFLADDGKALLQEYTDVPNNMKFERPIENECILATIKAVVEKREETLNHLRNLTTGELLFMEGEAPDSLYWLVAGELTVYTSVDGVEREVGSVHKEEIVGEMAFLGVESRSATLRAKTSCQLLEIPPDKFLGIVDSQPKWFQSILKTMSNRLLESNKK